MKLFQEMEQDPLLRKSKSLSELMFSSVQEKMDALALQVQILLEKRLKDFSEKIFAIISEIELQQGDPGIPADEETVINRLLPLLVEKIPPALQGEPGKNYSLTEKDKTDIAKKINVPIVEKRIIERIIEKPLVTNQVIREIKEISVKETPEELARKLNLLSQAIDTNTIRGFQEIIEQIYKVINQKIKQVKPYLHGGGGSSSAGVNLSTELLSGTQSGDNTTLDLAGLSHTFSAILLVVRNGQIITPTTDWTRVMNTITVTNASASDVYLIQYSY